MLTFTGSIVTVGNDFCRNTAFFELKLGGVPPLLIWAFAHHAVTHKNTVTSKSFFIKNIFYWCKIK